MSNFLERLQIEKAELADKVNKLGNFLSNEKSTTLSEANILLLQEQYNIMVRYLNVLIIRIELLNK